jgi:Putative Actinobacterial Holin-X, holin superfamily III
MAHNTLQDTALVRALTDLMTDLSDLFQKEVRLARAEISHKLTLRLQAAAWIGVAGLLALIVVLLIVEAAVFALASAGLALHWSCLAVAGILAVAAAVAFYAGRTAGTEDLSPTRSARQFNEAIRTAKEQMQ